MKIALDISPIKTGHKVRGIGSYTEKLAEELQKHKDQVELELFENPKSPPPADTIHYPYFDLFSHTLPIRTNKSRVVTIHDVICDSESSRSDIISKLSYPKEKIHVIYLAPGSNFQRIEDSKYLSDVTKRFKLPKTFILYV